MKRNSIRLLIVLATISIAGIFITQMYWVKKAFDLKDTQFNVNVSLGLKNVADSVSGVKQLRTDSLSPVNQLSSNYFVVNMKQQPDPVFLEKQLKREFTKRGLLLNFGLVIYNEDRLVYGKCISFNQTAMDTSRLQGLPDWRGRRIYFGIYFPNKNAELAGQMSIWIFSSVVLLMVIVFFAYTLYVILKQRRLSEVQRDFVNNMTHEFQTPISSVLISAKVLQDPGITETPDRLRTYASLIHTEISKLKNQVERILEMSEQETNQIRLKKEPVNIHELIKATKGKLVDALHIREEIVRTDLLADQPVLYADRVHMENIIYNLLENAVKYSDEVTDVKISTRNERNGVIICVADKGIGIKTDQQKKIFEKFYRVPQGNRHDVKGFGLGLSYVSLFTKAHHGIIDVYSKPGEGSKFVLFFPIS